MHGRLHERSLSLRRAWIEIGSVCSQSKSGLSLSLRRAWNEMYMPEPLYDGTMGRSPYGERGLKWSVMVVTLHQRCRSPYGERGLKLDVSDGRHPDRGRSPYGERGLKYKLGTRTYRNTPSLSLRRAWIEIYGIACGCEIRESSLSLRRAWIEIEERDVG